MIEVALATHQSERFLRDLLESLFAQSRQGFTLVVADDGSTDGTMEILRIWSERHPGRFRILPEDKEARGLRPNFARLLDQLAADYVLMCDHDDVWLPGKIALSLELMLALEARHPADTPLLVHTDLVVVGPGLEILDPSFFAYSDIDPGRNDLRSLLLSNVVTGCATIVNRSLYERARPIPPEALMYDHWLALVAAALGAIQYVEEATILYRQHGRNAIGARKPRTDTLLRRLQILFSEDRYRVMMRYSHQAAILLGRYGASMSDDARRATSDLAGLSSVSRGGRLAQLRRNAPALRGLARDAALAIVGRRPGPTRRRPEGRK